MWLAALPHRGWTNVQRGRGLPRQAAPLPTRDGFRLRPVSRKGTEALASGDGLASPTLAAMDRHLAEAIADGYERWGATGDLSLKAS